MSMASGLRRSSDPHLRVLIVGDAAFEDEFQSALAGVPDRPCVTYTAQSPRDAVDLASRREPHLIVIEIANEVGEVAELSRQLHEAAPDAAIAGAFRPDRLDGSTVTIVELLRAHIRDFLQRPVSAIELRASLDRLLTRPAVAGATANQGRVVSFISNKGGVGKSTLAVNLAAALAVRYPDEVLLIDTSLQLGSCSFMLDLKPSTSIVDAVRERDRLDRTLLRHLALRHGSGLRLLAAPPDALEGTEVDDEAVARIINMARRSFRYVVIDTFPALDSILMAVLDLSDTAFVVLQGTAPGVAGVARLLPVIEGLGLPESRQRLVLNYNFEPFLGNLRASDIADRLNRTIDYEVPYDKRVLVSMNTGVPEVLNTGFLRRFRRAVLRLADDLSLHADDAAVTG